MNYLIKIALTVLLVIGASETGKRFPAFGAATMSLPLVSMIVMSFMYYDTRDNVKLVEFARAMPPLMLPSVVFFYAFAFLVESNVGFVMAMILSTGIMVAGYGAYLFWARNT